MRVEKFVVVWVLGKVSYTDISSELGIIKWY